MGIYIKRPDRDRHHVPGQDVTHNQRVWLARFYREGRPDPIEVELFKDEDDVNQLRALLEREPEWQYTG
jgi:hypothetical protein